MKAGEANAKYKQKLGQRVRLKGQRQSRSKSFYDCNKQRTEKLFQNNAFKLIYDLIT